MREVSPSMARCELTHLPRQAIDLGRARHQHERYRDAVSDLVCSVRWLPADPALPDSVFVEDTCIVLDELMVITRPGAESRRPETAAIADQLRGYRIQRFIEAPGTLDGGDVLCLDRRIFIGRSSRSNDSGIEQFRNFVTPYGYSVTALTFNGCLHLKSAVTSIGENLLLVNRDWVDQAAFPGAGFIEVDPGEPLAANALRIGDTVIHAAEFPATRRRMDAAGSKVIPVEMSEFAKSEGGVTCCSLVFAADMSFLW